MRGNASKKIYFDQTETRSDSVILSCAAKPSRESVYVLFLWRSIGIFSTANCRSIRRSSASVQLYDRSCRTMELPARGTIYKSKLFIATLNKTPIVGKSYINNSQERIIHSLLPCRKTPGIRLWLALFFVIRVAVYTGMGSNICYQFYHYPAKNNTFSFATA